MEWLRVLFWLLPRRLRSSWVLLAVASFGMLAAVTLMAVGATYFRTLSEAGLREVVASTDQRLLDVQVFVQNRPMGRADYELVHSTVDDTTRDRLGHLLGDVQRYGRAQPGLALVPARDEVRIPLQPPSGQPFFVTGFRDHTRIVQGRWPQAAPGASDESAYLEVVAGTRAAAFMSWEVGSRAYLIPDPSNPSRRVTLEVVGLAEPMDRGELFWRGTSPIYFEPDPDNPWVPLYVGEEAFFQDVGARFPGLLGDYGWYFSSDAGLLTSSSVSPTLGALEGLQADLAKIIPRSLVLSGLEGVLEDFQRERAHARAPLFLFISLVVVVVLYFLALVAGILARTRSDEASLFRSRGASMLQVSWVLTLGEGLAALVAIVVGPFLALLIVRHLLLRTIDPVGDSAGGQAVSVGLTGDAFLLAALGGLLGFLVLIASGMNLARLGIVEYLRVRARPPSVPLLQRYYVDLLVIALMALLWWQVHDRDGFEERELLGKSLDLNPSLLLGPALVLLAAALVVFRVLPLVVRLLALVGNHLAPAWAAFALSRIARDPLPHCSLVIILMLSAALGVFGSAFQPTLARSQRDQALYATGSDLVIRGSTLATATLEELSALPGVEALSPVGRDFTMTLLDVFPNRFATLLSVDPDQISRASWFRDDFADRSLPEVMGALQGNPGDPAGSGVRGVVLPSVAETVGVWVNPDNLTSSFLGRVVALWVGVSDVEGRFHNVLLGDVPAAQAGPAGASPVGWMYLEGALPLDVVPMEPPFTVTSVSISGGSLSGILAGSIGLDDLTVKGSSLPASGTVVEDFEDVSAAEQRWVALANDGPVADTLEYGPQSAMQGNSGLALTWHEPLTDAKRGVLIPPGPYPLPAIGGPMFRAGQVVRIHSDRQLLPLVVVDVVDFFPTLDPSHRPFLIVSLADYRQHIIALGGGLLNPPEEFWVSLEDGAGRWDVIASLQDRLPRSGRVQDGVALVEGVQLSPLAGGGWNGLTILGVSALTVAVVLALGTWSAVSVQGSRVDFTVARALGLSGRQLVFSLALERIVVAVLGVAAGVALGLWLGQWVLGFLDTTAGGALVLPPMVVIHSPWLMALVFANLAAALAVGIVLGGVAARRLKAFDILRVGQ